MCGSPGMVAFASVVGIALTVVLVALPWVASTSSAGLRGGSPRAAPVPHSQTGDDAKCMRRRPKCRARGQVPKLRAGCSSHPGGTIQVCS
jgi:hypothetical protein